jgi:hypothetical protein
MRQTRISFLVYPIGQFFHLHFMIGTNGTFVVAENGNFPVAVIVKLNFFLDGEVRVLELFEEG